MEIEFEIEIFARKRNELIENKCIFVFEVFYPHCKVAPTTFLSLWLQETSSQIRQFGANDRNFLLL